MCCQVLCRTFETLLRLKLTLFGMFFDSTKRKVLKAVKEMRNVLMVAGLAHGMSVSILPTKFLSYSPWLVLLCQKNTRTHTSAGCALILW